MNTVRVNAYAKLNLTLDLCGTEEGYHLIDSLVVTVNLYDRIVVRKRKDARSNIRMHGMESESIPPEANNALRAAEAFSARFGTCGADITVYKNIPIGAGLGGSSADAAGVLKALAKLYDISDMGALKEVADTLGSDTGYLIFGGFARMRGRGEKVEPLGEAPELHFLVLVPKSGVSAGECYREYDRLGQTHAPRTDRVLALMKKGDGDAFRLFGNGLTAAASSLDPDVKEALKEARSFSPIVAGMTGSGSAVYALFETEELCEWARSRYRGKCRAYTLKTVTPKVENGYSPFAIGEGEGE